MGTKTLALLMALLTALPVGAQDDDRRFQSLLERRTELSKQRSELQRKSSSTGRSSTGREGAVARLEQRLREAQQDFADRREELGRESQAHARQRPARRADEQAQLRRELNDLQDEKREALRELRLGFYCSKCKRTQSEIEKATKRPFGEHLSEVDGEPVPASPEEIAAKEREYDQKIEGVQRKIEALEQRDAEAQRRYDQRTAELNREQAELGVEERAELAEIRRQISDARAQEQRSVRDDEARLRDQLRSVDEQLTEVEEELGRLRFAPRPAPDLSYLLEGGHQRSDNSVFGTERTPVDLDDYPEAQEPRRFVEPAPYEGARAEDQWIDFDADEVQSDSGLPNLLELDQAVGEGVNQALGKLGQLRSKAVEGLRDYGLLPKEPIEGEDVALRRAKSSATSRLLGLNREERGMKRASSIVAKLAPRAVKKIEDGAHAGLSPSERFKREAAPTAVSSWGYMLNEHIIDHLLVPIRTYFSSYSEQPPDDYLGGNDR